MKFFLVLLLSVLSMNLTAQDEPKKLKYRASFGFSFGVPVLTEEGRDIFDNINDAGLDGKETHFYLGYRSMLLAAFPLAKSYSLGFGAVFSGTYHRTSLIGDVAIGSYRNGIVVEGSSYLYERVLFSIAPVFYNELNLGEFAFSLAFGPTFGLNFADSLSLETPSLNGVTVRASQDVDYEQQFLFGLLVDLGFTMLYNKSLGMGINTFFEFYFTGHRIGMDKDNPYDNDNSLHGSSAFLGNWGISVSLIIYE